MSPAYGFTLAVCAEMVFLEKPIEERVALIHDLGFAVEIWDWTTKDLDALAGTGAQFTSMTGYVAGNLTDPDGADTLFRTAERSIAAAARLGTPNLNLHGTGLDGQGLPVNRSRPSPIRCGEREHERSTGSPTSVNAKASPSASRTSTPRSTTQAPRSPEPPTPAHSSKPSTTHTCG